MLPRNIVGMHGLGDNIYQRAMLPRDQVIYLQTPWPEIYQDMLNVRPVRTNSSLRTQKKNEARVHKWHAMPFTGERSRRFNYTGFPVIEGMEKSTGLTFHQMSLPDYGTRPIQEPYIVMRPATIRREWMAAARNPRPDYLVRAAEMVRAAGFKVVLVADVNGDDEWLDGELPPSDVQYLNGQLHITELLRHTQHAAGVIGGIGWILPAAIAQRRPALIICGGEGGWNSPEQLTDPRMVGHKVTFAIPDNFCRCKNHGHACDKTITRFEQIAARWVADLVA